MAGTQTDVHAFRSIDALTGLPNEYALMASLNDLIHARVPFRAAVIGLPHPKWSERPLLIVVAEEDSGLTGEEVLAYLDGKIAKWWMPDAVEFIDEIPHTATGKIQKMDLREQYKDYEFKS